jgi:restriction system protein
MLGKQHKYFNECYDNKYVGVGFDIEIDLKNDLPDNWREFNKKYIPFYLNKNPDKSKVTAGLACGAVWTVSKGMNIGDILLCPDGQRNYKIGKISGDYFYDATIPSLLHRRSVEWLPVSISRDEMSQELKNSTGSIGTVSDISKYSSEIDKFIEGESPIKISSTDSEIENPSMFALESHLEHFIIENWEQTILAKDYDIFQDGELTGKQFPTDTGPIDILAISKDKKELLVIELKKGRASDSVVGQIQRYMGYIKDEFLESGQKVKGIIIALENDTKVKRALSVTNDIDFYQYKINFDLIKN